MQQNRPNTPKMTDGLVQHITVEESNSIQWVDIFVCFTVYKCTRIELTGSFLLKIGLFIVFLKIVENFCKVMVERVAN